MRWIARVVLTAMIPTAAMSQGQPLSPRQTFEDDRLLLEATEDVASMPMDELEMFIDALAACATDQSEAVGRYHCTRDRTRFQIHFARKRSIDRLLEAVNLFEAWERGSNAARQHTRYLEIVQRLTEIKLTLHSAANDRAAALRSAR